MTFRSAVITFPGSNCDRDMAVALEQVCGGQVHRVWHGDADLPEGLDFIALPGGFSYGDYLRSGAMAARSPIMQAVIAAASRGVPVLGGVQRVPGPDRKRAAARCASSAAKWR
jgi:phosphoribosylformylglycinamidine (FGAM) synthase-like amidotransferase family enzyme